MPNSKKRRPVTEDFQKALTPQDVLEMGRKGNMRFIDGTQLLRDIKFEQIETSKSQHPVAIVIGCIDSRAPAEFIFDAGIGDIFNARIAGNFVNTDIAGCAEFACKVSGSKLVLIMGHTFCGAIKGAIDNVNLGNITSMLSNVTPAIDAVKGFDGVRTSSNPEFVSAVTRENVILNVKKLRHISPILKEMEEKGEILIAGCIYDIETGKVEMII